MELTAFAVSLRTLGYPARVEKQAQLGFNLYTSFLLPPRRL
jgi:hypothetical protein